MKLTYRGVSYEYTPPQIEAQATGLDGKYRGLDVRFRHLKKAPVLQPTVNLTYRGFKYQTPGTTSAEAAPEKTLVASIQDKARSLMSHQHHTTKHRQQAMLIRSAAEVGLMAH